MVVIASLHYLSISLVWFYFCFPCPPRPRLEQIAFYNHSVLSRWPLSPAYHLKFISGSWNCKHSNCCLNICPFSCNSLFQKNEILTVESRVYLPAMGCAFVLRSEQQSFPSLSIPFALSPVLASPSAWEPTNQNASLCLDSQSENILIPAFIKPLWLGA